MFLNDGEQGITNISNAAGREVLTMTTYKVFDSAIRRLCRDDSGACQCCLCIFTDELVNAFCGHPAIGVFASFNSVVFEIQNVNMLGNSKFVQSDTVIQFHAEARFVDCLASENHNFRTKNQTIIFQAIDVVGDADFFVTDLGNFETLNTQRHDEGSLNFHLTLFHCRSNVGVSGVFYFQSRSGHFENPWEFDRERFSS